VRPRTQVQLGIHFVWPNPLTNRFTNVQLHPSVRALPGRVGALSIFRSESVLYGAFVWVCNVIILTG
jgi:hypothetical protein